MTQASAVPSLCGLPLYALIDPMQGEPALIGQPSGKPADYDALAQLRAQAWQRAVWISRDQRPLIDPMKLPYIVALDGASDPLMSEIVQAAQQEAEQALDSGTARFTIGALIETALPAGALLERLEGMWTVAPLSERRYARIAERRCFEMLAHLLSAEELQQWLGPIARWHVLARSGVWVAHIGAADDTLIDSEEGWLTRASRLGQLRELRARLPRSHEHVQHMQLAEAHSLALTTLQHKQLPAHRWSEAHRLAWDALLHARRELRLQADADLAAYAWRAVLEPHRLKESTAVQAVNDARSAPGSLEAALTAVEAAADKDAQQSPFFFIR